MTITAWRIVKAVHSVLAFDGEGAFRFGGRWNNKGARVVYTAQSQALAVLELLVHLKRADLPRHYRLISVTFEDKMIRAIDPAELPANWKRRPPPASIRRMGDDWAATGESLVLRVPSAVVPDEHNYILNVEHPDFAKLRIGKPMPYRFDTRLR